MFRITNPHLRPAPREYQFITVIGNVGAGKSTLTRSLSGLLGFDASAHPLKPLHGELRPFPRSLCRH